MCYLVYLSTTSEDDLSRLPSNLYYFRPLTEADDPEVVRLLAYPARWYLECQYGGCSCHFRHFSGESTADFFPPTDWLPEDADDIAATRAVYDVLARISADGHNADLLDIWEGTQPEAVVSLSVSLTEVDRESFRFFEQRRFDLQR